MGSSLGTVTSSTGLFSGIDYESYIEKMLEIAGKPRDLLTDRTNTLQSQSAALGKLMANLLSVEYMTDNLGKSGLFASRSAASSDSAVMTATVDGSPALGTYQFTCVRTAQSQQATSTGFASSSAALGAGTFNFRYGDDLASTQSLGVLNGGDGFVRGKIRITDRSGASSTIDLSAATSLDDVINAINDDETINVTAEFHGDAIRLTDETGQTTANLKVQEVGSGKTAAALGLSGIDAATATAQGRDILSLSADLNLSTLNDGMGVQFNTALADIQYTLADGTTGDIDLSPLLSGGSTVDAEVTLGDVIDRINAAAPGKLQARISGDGDHLEIVDLTSGTGEFTLSSQYDSQALTSLGLTGEAVDGVIQSGRLLGGLGTALLSRLNGGRGLGTLGTLEITDSSGATATVNLSGAETVDDVLDAINAAGTGITAKLNDSRTGITLVDSSTGTGNLKVASGSDGLDTAGKLKLAVDADVNSVDSGDLHLAAVGWNTALSDLRGGAGVAQGKFILTDSSGQSATINIDSDITTVGQVIQEINRGGIGVEAAINDAGDGIVIRDTAGGTSTLLVTESGSTTAADLHLLAEVVTADGKQSVNGSMTYTVELDADDTLTDLKTKINDLDVGLQASIFSDGSSKPYRLTLSSEQSGSVGRFVFTSTGISLGLSESARAQDAVISMGNTSSPTSMLMTSSTNTFTGVVEGLTLKVKNASASAVSITVSSSTTDLVANIKTFVTNYNTFRKTLDDNTAFNSETNQASLLTGDATALRLDTDLPDLLSGTFLGSSASIRSLAQLGVSLGEDGDLAFDQTVLEDAFEKDPAAVETFFTDEKSGFSAKFHTLLEQLAGEEKSLLSLRMENLQEKIDRNTKKIEWYNDRLDKESDAMYLKFYRMEVALASLQDNLKVIESLSPLDPYTGSSS
jgi:flagellar hook-associated protein 2